MEFLNYYHDKIVLETVQHCLILVYSLPFALIIGVGAGFLVADRPLARSIVLILSSAIMTVPGLALFGIMVVVLAPLQMGIGVAPAVVAITLYSLLPVVRNTTTALNSVDPSVITAARSMGMTGTQILFRIKAPLSMPTIMAGIRNAIVMGVGVAAFGFMVAAGGLGYFIFSGIARSNVQMVLTGAILISVLGVGLNYLFLSFEKRMQKRD
ncbi:MAG: choline ABC transporter permease [Spirochaetaceae bacterium]|nr:choline ABC transporter permease [Spirochaetaceae bacterium]|tara:strand:- start:77666 stop:78298 length:633 start_codon:yes stop_codon:yes gene_type:complete